MEPVITPSVLQIAEARLAADYLARAAAWIEQHADLALEIESIRLRVLSQVAGAETWRA
jgi:hypothetical protein